MKKKTVKRLLWFFITAFILINTIAALQAYNFSHFADSNVEKIKDSDPIPFFKKVKILFTGIAIPRPVNKAVPSQKFETIKLQSNKLIECWSIKSDSSKGTVIIFHGYAGSKSTMIDKSDEFIKLGYNTLLVDFMGSGGSEGNQTTVGFKEAEEVKTCYDYLIKQGETKIYLFGTSMGAAAVLKSVSDYHLNPTAIIIECPFGSMYKTTAGRFSVMGVPSFPAAALLVFWGGIENNFWGFNFSPIDYAGDVKCPTLLLYGGSDKRVSRQEIDDIYSNLQGTKQLKIYPLAGHENYLTKYKEQWVSDIKDFFQLIK